MKLRNKISSLFAVVALAMATMIPSAFADDYTITVTGDTVKAGESAIVTFSIAGNPGLNCLSFVATYDSTFTVSSVDTTSCALLNYDESAINKGTTGKNSYKFDWYEETGEADYDGNGELIKMTVAVPAGTLAGNYPITVDVKDSFNASLDDFEPAVVTANIVVEADAPAGTSTKYVYTDGNTYALSKNAFAFNGTDYDFDKKYDVVVKYNNAETKTYAWSWKNDLGIDGVGEVSGNVKFGVKISDPVTYDATLFTFDLVEVQ